MNPFTHPLDRRQFLATAGAASLAAWSASPARAAAPSFKTTIRKAKILGNPDEAMLRQLKEAGFDGIEVSTIMVEDRAKRTRELVEAAGLKCAGNSASDASHPPRCTRRVAPPRCVAASSDTWQRRPG